MADMDNLMSLVAEGAEYALSSNADGTRFRLSYKTDKMTADLTGDDAARFKADYETVQGQMPGAAADQLLAQLWDQGGYSWLAAQDG